MLADAFMEVVSGFSRFQNAIAALEAELKATQQAVKALEARLEAFEAADGIDVEVIDRILENYDLAAKVEAVLETHTFDGMLEDKVREAIDAYDFCEDIDNALSGREVTVTL
jgi:multidrug efflux pump subunit AcrA (membrane-fusion protein)